jgi:hypothetical protein
LVPRNRDRIEHPISAKARADVTANYAAPQYVRAAKPGTGEPTDFGRPKTAHQAVAEAVRRDVSSGRFPPGSWIVQENLVELYGVSRIPIREAAINLVGSAQP